MKSLKEVIKTKKLIDEEEEMTEKEKEYRQNMLNQINEEIENFIRH